MSGSLEIVWRGRNGVTCDGFHIEIERVIDTRRDWAARIYAPDGRFYTDRARTSRRAKLVAFALVAKLRAA
jgi:hypothetical protein